MGLKLSSKTAHHLKNRHSYICEGQTFCRINRINAGQVCSIYRLGAEHCLFLGIYESLLSIIDI